MIFNSFSFAVFFAATFIAFSLVRSDRGRVRLFLGASLLFYASWRAPFLALLLGSVTMNFLAGSYMDRFPDHKKLILRLSIALNLIALGFYKYADFFSQNVANLLAFAGLDVQPESLGLALPLGISFFTFQAMSYTIDVYRGSTEPVRSFTDFAAYVTFFPQLIAGPIVRASEFFPQLKGLATRRRNTFGAVSVILIGLVKKVILANWLGSYADDVFWASDQYTAAVNLIAVYAYAFQIFFDFSGYCDIAIGCAALLGIRLPENFKQPYLAMSVVEFWARWHITLTVWFRDYVYVPIALKRDASGKLKSRPYMALFATWALTGLWHGAGWTFVAWGALHGVYLAIYRIWRGKWRAKKNPGLVKRSLSIVATFNLVCVGYVFFRSRTIEDAVKILERILVALATADLQLLLVGLVGLPLVLYGYSLSSTAADRLRGAFQSPSIATAFLYGLLVGVFLVALSLLAAPGAPFIYFVF